MTWDLAESGNEFITTVINGADLVPTFSAASVDDLRTEVEILTIMLKIIYLYLLPKPVFVLEDLFSFAYIFDILK